MQEDVLFQLLEKTEMRPDGGKIKEELFPNLDNGTFPEISNEFGPPEYLDVSLKTFFLKLIFLKSKFNVYFIKNIVIFSKSDCKKSFSRMTRSFLRTALRRSPLNWAITLRPTSRLRARTVKRLTEKRKRRKTKRRSPKTTTPTSPGDQYYFFFVILNHTS